MMIAKPQAQPAVANNPVTISYIKEMKTDKELALIRTVAGQWENAAAGKIGYFGKRNEKEKVEVSKDAHEVAEGINCILGDRGAIKAKRVSNPIYTTESIKKGYCVAFAAYDNRGKIQGVALVNLKGDVDHAAVLDELIVNPERVKSIGKRTPISGTGTKLVQAASEKILNGKGTKELGTFSLMSSKTFYEKLGFAYDNSEFGGDDVRGMCLNEQGLKNLCQKV